MTPLMKMTETDPPVSDSWARYSPFWVSVSLTCHLMSCGFHKGFPGVPQGNQRGGRIGETAVVPYTYFSGRVHFDQFGEVASGTFFEFHDYK
jgi:hypothetical protein